ncbi:aminopeptidase P family N-terminal domain-containing protein, partial [Photobacterium sanctipauli]
VQWAQDNLAAGSKVAIDARLHSGAWLTRTTEALNGALELVCIEQNPIELHWDDRPAPTLSNAKLMGLDYVGQSSADKRALIAAELKKQKADAVLLTQLDSIAWLLNVRGSDVPSLPVLLSTAILHADESVDFFIDPARL